MNTWLSIILIGTGGLARAETLTFPEVWDLVQKNSAAQQSSRLITEAASLSESRAGRHWLPRVYLEARSYRTSDPGASFQGLLEQRSLQATDFAPDSLNHPAARTFTRGTLGVELPLWEGGEGGAGVAAAAAAHEARAEAGAQVRVEQYAETGRAYAALVALSRGTETFEKMLSEVERLRKSYRLGNRANPVGYSGALGLQAVSNLLSGQLQDFQARLQGTKELLKELGVNSASWKPESLTTAAFSERFLAAPGSAEASHRIAALRAEARAGEQAVALERSTQLPQFGLFAEGYGFNGNRDTATGASAGVYLRWNLFQPSRYGAADEARLRAAALDRAAEAEAQQERARRQGLDAIVKALRSNLDLLADSEKALDEQLKVTELLFRNGSVNALQLSEVAGRRAQIAAQRLEAELAYLDSAAKAFSVNRNALPREMER